MANIFEVTAEEIGRLNPSQLTKILGQLLLNEAQYNGIARSNGKRPRP
jgi:hypothetical protein